MRLDSKAQCVEPGQVLFVREGILLGQRLNLETVRPERASRSRSQIRALCFFATGAAQFSGRLAVRLCGRVEGSRESPASTGPAGKAPLLGTPGDGNRLFVSRDGQTAALDRLSSQGTMDVWSIDVARGIETRLTSDPGIEAGPVFVPGGPHCDLRLDETGRTAESREEEPRHRDRGIPLAVLALAPASRRCVERRTNAVVFSAGAGRAVRSLDACRWRGGAAAAVPRVACRRNASARFSPDGRFVAYVSNDSGRRDVHLAPFPGGGIDACVERRREASAMERRRPRALLHFWHGRDHRRFHTDDAGAAGRPPAFVVRDRGPAALARV
mgnify:CR=1 FL=1